MAPKSHMVVYGNLSQEQVSFDVSFHTVDKLISGIRMPRWTGSLSPEELRKWLQLIADDLEKNDGKVFGTKVIQEIGLENWKQAITDSQADASQGKYLVKCIQE